jgi:hypothetical protein
MIQKVSSQNNLDWVGEGDAIRHTSINKSALNSFESILIKTANKSLAEGQSIVEVAAKFNMSVSDLENIIAPVEKQASTQKESAPEATHNEIDGAQAAYDSLRGLQPQGDSKFIPVNGHSVLSARAENITEMGGPKRQIRSHNSIWDSEVIENLAKQKDNGELLREARNKEVARREEIKAISRDANINVAELSKTIQQKDASIQNLSAQESHKYSKKLPVNSMSMFDTKEFERIQDKTGEMKPKTAKKDNASTEDLLQNHSKQLLNKIFDNLGVNKE